MALRAPVAGGATPRLQRSNVWRPDALYYIDRSKSMVPSQLHVPTTRIPRTSSVVARGSIARISLAARGGRLAAFGRRCGPRW